MALTEIKTSGIADDAVTADKLANAINTERTANTAKATNATHSGDVTGSGSLTIADNAVTLAKMAGGTDGQIITYDANGDPVAVGPGTDGQVLTSTGAGSPPAFETPAAVVGGATGADFNDDVKLRFGTGNDLEIYHDSNHSFIKDNGTGAIKIRGDDVRIEDAAGNNIIKGTATAAELYYDGSKKLETRSAGVNTLGNHYVLDDTFFGCGDGADLQIKHSATGNLSSITHSGAGKFDIVSTGDDLNIKSSENVVLMTNDTEIGVYVIKNGTVKLYHDGTEQCSTSANGLAFPDGKGIDFSATSDGGATTPSELLDDYEEGTFTPTIVPGGTAGTISYSNQNGFYTKVGNLVNVWAMINFTESGSSGSLNIGSLPFTSSSTTGNYAVGVFQCNDMQDSYQSNVGQYTVYMSTNATTCAFRGTRSDGAGFETMQMQNMQYLRIQLTYRV